MRSLRGFPPFRDLFVLTASGTEESRVLQVCMKLRRTLEGWLDTDAYRQADTLLLGPAPATIAKVNNRYRYRITLSGKNTKQMRSLMANLICATQSDRESRGVSVFVDVNPLD